MWHTSKKWFDRLYDELISFRESIHIVALSFAMGVFLGILPMTGVLAAIALAWYFRLNKAAAILGSVITNTWLGFIVLAIAIKVSTVFLGLNNHDIEMEFQRLVDHFQWQDLWQSSFIRLIVPVIFSYLFISLLWSLISYFLAFAIISWHRGRKL